MWMTHPLSLCSVLQPSESLGTGWGWGSSPPLLALGVGILSLPLPTPMCPCHRPSCAILAAPQCKRIGVLTRGRPSRPGNCNIHFSVLWSFCLLSGEGGHYRLRAVRWGGFYFGKRWLLCLPGNHSTANWCVGGYGKSFVPPDIPLPCRVAGCALWWLPS